MLTVRRFVFAVVVGLFLSMVVAFGVNAQGCPRGADPLQCDRDNDAQARARMRVDHARAFGGWYGDPYRYNGGYGSDYLVRGSIAYDPSIKRKFATVGADLAYQAGQVGVSKLAQKMLGQGAQYGGPSGVVQFTDIPENAKVYLDGEYVGRGKGLNGKKMKFIAGLGLEAKIISHNGDTLFEESVAVLPKHTTIISP